MKVIIAGGRKFNDYTTLCKYCDHILQDTDPVEIVCGMAKGVDLLGKDYAELKGWDVKKFPADWNNLDVENVVIRTNKWGKSYNVMAGHNRNEEMAKYADAAIIFWDGVSKGSGHMIDLANKHNLKLRIYKWHGG